MREDDLAVLGGGVAGFALLVRKGRVHEAGHEFGSIGLVRVVALQAIRSTEWLILVGLLQVGVFGIVAIDAQSGSGFGEMKIKFDFAGFAGLVGDVAGLAAHVERGMAAALRRNVDTDGVARQAEILFVGGAASGLQEFVLVVGFMRIVALEAIPDGGTVNLALDVGRILVGVAGKAERGGSSGGELDARHVFVDANFVTAKTSSGNGGVDVLALGLVSMTLEALCRVGILVERNRMDVSEGRNGENTNDEKNNDEKFGGGKEVPERMV